MTTYSFLDEMKVNFLEILNRKSPLPIDIDDLAIQFVNEVLNNKNTVKTDLSRGGVEYRLPDGRGVRYNSDGSFSGFLDPKMPR